MSEETTTPVSTEATLEQDLATIMTQAEKPAEPKPAELGTELEKPAEVSLDDQLKEIDEPVTEEAAKSALTAEQERILAAVPNPQIAEHLVQTARNYDNFTGAFERGDFESVDNMFQQWNPQAYDAFLEHVYAQKVASGEWVDRWISDKEGNPTTNKAVSRLEREIQGLKQQLSQRSTQEQQSYQQQQQQRAYQAYNTHVDSLFDKIKFSNADRRWVSADIQSRINNSPNVRDAIMAGNPQAVNALFKQAVREYVQRDQSESQVKDGALKAQEGKKPLLQSSPQVQGALPTDWKEVPKDRLEDALDEQLNNLYASAGKKKR